MYSCTKTCTLTGLNGYPVDVEVDLSNGMPKIILVGLADTAVKESTERVKSAIKNSGFDFPKKRITINLAPANLRKDGTQLDLAIAVSLLSCDESLEMDYSPYVYMGELALDGKINKIQGALPMVISMREKGYRKFIVPYENRKECAIVSDVEIYPVKTLEEVVSFIRGEIQIERCVGSLKREKVSYDMDFSDIKGQENLKRALEISASAKSNILILGSPGSGKTMAAKRFPTILPELDFEEAIEVTKIYSISGLLDDNSLITKPPFRSPHHTASAVSLIGGGRIPKPGEISLAHKGVLFLDELPEFSKSVLEVLRQPMESKDIIISRANANVKYPADFQLVVALNPCPCGYHNSKTHECTCSPYEIQRYLSKISHPLLDSKFLNDAKFEKLIYKSQKGTDLEVGLPKGYIFAGAGDVNSDGEEFIANMPSEEVFSAPRLDGVNGKVYSTLPLNYNGNLIEDFYLVFKDGEVVDYDAKAGKEYLKNILDTDEGAKRLGEVALVSYNTPISMRKVLFYNTLYDENASCHFALGKSYPTCLEGGEKLSIEELKERGMNDSLTHVDFMVGDETTEIIGVKENGEEVQIFKEGNFVI
ncbi:YifB family Mg chelatase-like AAA ATPase [Peptoniphilus genitalis]